MTGTIISLHGDQHDAVNALLPWYVTDTLDADERVRVEAHLAVCQTCQADLASERRLKALMADTAVDGDAVDEPNRGFARLMAEIDATPEAPRPTVRRQWRDSPAWMRWAIAAQLLLLAGGGVWLGVALKPGPQPQYHALASADQPRPGNIVVVFRPDARESDVRGALRAAHARLVDGPTEADAYILTVPAAGRDAALQALRADKAVVVAEPLGDGARK